MFYSTRFRFGASKRKLLKHGIFPFCRHFVRFVMAGGAGAQSRTPVHVSVEMTAKSDAMRVAVEMLQLI